MGVMHTFRDYSPLFIRMLSVSVVPTIIVLHNKTGKVITSWGMEAIESNNDPKRIINDWRIGNSSVPFHVRLTSTCEIS